MFSFDPNGLWTRSSSLPRREPLADSAQQRLARDHDLGARNFLMSLYVIANVRKEDVLVFADQQKSGTSRETAKISDVGKMTDQQPVEASGSYILAESFLSGTEVHR